MQTKTYLVVDPVDHDNKRYAPRDPIVLNDEQAKPLLGVKAIAEPTGEDDQALQRLAEAGRDGEDLGHTPTWEELLAQVEQLGLQLATARADLEHERTVSQAAIGDLEAGLADAAARLQQARDEAQQAQTQLAELGTAHDALKTANEALTAQLEAAKAAATIAKPKAGRAA